ncbi:hypothetical protein BHM03_00016016 [Ensete ventricosum]|nr:hypothetical protein BHM03_00016016 [Ensete ventricosum]
MSSASSHFESHSVKVSAHRSRTLSHPSGDSRSIAIISSSGGAALADPGAADAFTAMRSYFNVNSTVTTHRLVEVRKNYFVPSEYELHAPLLGEHPYDTFPSGFSLSTDTLEVGLRFPLHPVIEACLKGWQISPSQMVPNSWHYLVAFLWECYRLGIVATRELFMACFWLIQGQARYYLIARNGLRVRCTFQQQRLEVMLFLHLLSSRQELLDRVDISDGGQLGLGAFDQ